MAGAALFVTNTWAQVLDSAAPEQVGMSRGRLARIGPLMQKHVADGHVAGTSFWIDPTEQMIGVFMMRNLSDDFRKAQQFKQLAYQAIVD